MIILPEYVGPVNIRLHYYREPLHMRDEFGYPRDDSEWDYRSCVMDDFGNSVPVEYWPTYSEGYTSCLAPDYDNPPPEGEPYKYVVFFPTVH